MKKMSQRSVSMRPPARVVPPEVSARRQQDAAKRVAEMTQARPNAQEASRQFREMSNALPTRSQMAEMTQGRPVPEVARPPSGGTPPAFPAPQPVGAGPQAAPRPVQAPPVSTKPLMDSMSSNPPMGVHSIMGGQTMGGVPYGMKKGGKVKKAKGGSVSSASKRADGVAQRGKTRGKFV